MKSTVVFTGKFILYLFTIFAFDNVIIKFAPNSANPSSILNISPGTYFCVYVLVSFAAQELLTTPLIYKLTVPEEWPFL